jgi:hypothetical protein
MWYPLLEPLDVPMIIRIIDKDLRFAVPDCGAMIGPAMGLHVTVGKGEVRCISMPVSREGYPEVDPWEGRWVT